MVASVVAVDCGCGVTVGGATVGLACVEVGASVRAGEVHAATNKLRHNIFIKVVFMVISWSSSLRKILSAKHETLSVTIL